MPLETASYIPDLVATNPIHTDGIDQADSHIRLLKAVLQAQFPSIGDNPVNATAIGLSAAGTAGAVAGVFEVAGNGSSSGAELILDPVTGSGDVMIQNTGTNGGPGALTISINDHTDANPITAVTLTQAGAFSAAASVNAPSIMEAGNPLIPSGMIMLWYGSIASIPAGWTLCNGSNGTPDLNGIFVAGAGTGLAVAQTGGAASQTVTTSSAGTHNHGGADGPGGGVTPTGVTDTQGIHSHGGATANYTLQIADIPAHTHEEVIGNANTGPTPAQIVGNIVGTVGFVDAGIATDTTGGGGPHSHVINSDGAHSHNLVINALPLHTHSISSDGAHTHSATVVTLPPFVGLCYVMKL